MPNKTIYVRDENLWERAKKLAGAEGLSGLVGEALAEHVKRREQQRAAFQRGQAEMREVTLDVGGEDHRELHGEEVDHKIAFVGRLLHDTDIEALPRCAVYQTKSGKLLLYTTWDVGDRDEMGATYELFDSFEELAQSSAARNNFNLLQEFQVDRYAPLAEIARKLGKDLVIRIE
jgi:hypothetical protein